MADYTPEEIDELEGDAQRLVWCRARLIEEQTKVADLEEQRDDLLDYVRNLEARLGIVPH